MLSFPKKGGVFSCERRAFSLILLLFFLSGASGLVYEIVWIRILTRVFGTTSFAVSALLTSFMAGLGLGSYLGGRWLAHRGRSLFLFGALEIGVGAYALALPWLLPLSERAFIGAVGSLGLTLYGESLLKLVLSLALLLPPTTLMGASLPLLSQYSVERLGHLGTRVGSLYAVNTVGAVGGCFIAGFYAIAAWGIWGTTLAAAAVNFAVGTAAIGLGLASQPTKSEPPGGLQREDNVEPFAPYSARAVRWSIAAFAVSGFAALGLEVIWTRLISLVFTGYTYSFSTMLTVFLVGIAAGSLSFGRIADRSADPLRLFGLLEIAIGVSVLALTPLFLHAQGWARLLGLMHGGSWDGMAAGKFAVGFALLIVPTFLFGATFPVVSRLASRSLAGLGATIGKLYAANVAGGIAGAFATGFVLIPLAGTQSSLQILCGGLLVLGLALVVSSPRGSTAWKMAAATLSGAAALVALILGPTDLSLAIHQQWLTGKEQMGFYKEGAAATVMVAEHPRAGLSAEKRILVSGSSASNSSYYGLSVNRIQGCLPFLFERMPRRVLALCFGTGITFGTLTQFEVERVDGVEISPEVIEAAPRFAAENYDVALSPRARLHIDDGRNFLLKSRERYDAITMEPMPPALVGVVDFYTREFYRLCRSHLEPGGVVSQWVPLYFLGLEDVKMLYRTFAESFPYAMVFFYNFDTFMVGSDRPLDLSGSRFCERLRSERLLRDLAAIELDAPDRMLGAFLMGREAMLRFAGPAPLLSDDLPYVEFTGPKAIDLSTLPVNFLALTRFAESPGRYLRLEPGFPEARVRDLLEGIYRDNQIRWAMARGERIVD